ncbi:valine--tRNA ligase [Sporolactobacillus terrae]|uniref:Valine--tRNA ligase n=1 Tax=Sporolactobacillus terrae TaxID=269673 RepID=A0ABX5Q8E6_9BACL|nr:valine--tRNA ligase [Sporolactobacillus terrae]QAA22933.1 valine--tRNA ligase [Sporolactobacillus terrae]QAA25906.1 valine--tRNA ligase [Sporolactobacillus terrae]UAK17780.1 valine--tRNA ligase [Sporolactobacillus terrae]
MEKELATKYDPSQTEEKWYKTWLEKDYFKAEGDPEKKPYSIVIPPPNVTGKLHLGHAWDTTMQDLLIRFKRMQGYDALYLPGMDHAGIATQAKVDAKLRAEGKSRYDLGREKFLEVAWDWKKEYASFIRKQWAKLGLSLDYSRERFTLDEGLSKAVRKVFVSLYNKGLIYRGAYIINWDPAARTALSDIEVIYKEIPGHLWHVNYPLADGSGSIQIATTRPETMLGDTAIAVHPDDERYKAIVGKKAVVPLIGREIPIVADSYVDQSFGTGAVKITPAHDPNDFEVGNRHHLPRILVIDETGKMNENAGKYQGLDREECRKQIVKDLETSGELAYVEEHAHAVGHSERTGVVVEPILSTQWFVKMKPLAEASLNMQKTDDRVNFVPERFEGTYRRWMENIRDWCISRQLWWGHRVPAWYHKQTGEVYVGMEAPKDSENWKQDEDVLDTWFSSALWPFSTMGWPDEDASDFKRYFPTNALVTGYDIIFFWVARMMFQSTEFTGKSPFKDVLIHGLVRDEQGRKMSKSLGNGIDPMDVIAKYGADALRYTLATGTTPGQDLTFQWSKVEANWNFANKIWNASRFVIMNLEGFTFSDIDLSGKKSVADRWILQRLNATIEKVTALYETYDFGEAGHYLYQFIWDDFCDWYIEMAKLPLYGEDEAAKATTKSVLTNVLDKILKLLHPIMPFITEEIWQHIPHEGETIMHSDWPTVNAQWNDAEAEQEMTALQNVIRSVRNIRSEMNVAPKKPVELLIKTKSEQETTIFEANKDYIERFCNPETLAIGADIQAPEKAVSAVISGADIYLPLSGLINVDDEISRLKKELEKMNAEVERTKKKLSNPRFVDKAPGQVVNKEREKQADYIEKRDKLDARIAELQA